VLGGFCTGNLLWGSYVLVEIFLVYLPNLRLEPLYVQIELLLFHDSRLRCVRSEVQAGVQGLLLQEKQLHFLLVYHNRLQVFRLLLWFFLKICFLHAPLLLWFQQKLVVSRVAEALKVLRLAEIRIIEKLVRT